MYRGHRITHGQWRLNLYMVARHGLKRNNRRNSNSRPNGYYLLYGYRHSYQRLYKNSIGDCNGKSFTGSKCYAIRTHDMHRGGSVTHRKRGINIFVVAGCGIERHNRRNSNG